jgi:hypothetical protein
MTKSTVSTTLLLLFFYSVSAQFITDTTAGTLTTTDEVSIGAPSTNGYNLQVHGKARINSGSETSNLLNLNNWISNSIKYKGTMLNFTSTTDGSNGQFNFMEASDSDGTIFQLNSQGNFFTDGKAGFGNFNPQFHLTVGPNLNNNYTSSPGIAGIGIMSHGIGTAAGNIYLHRDDLTISVNNTLGAILFTGGDGGEQLGAEIRGVSAGNWSTGQSSSDLVFLTTTSGSSTPSEKLRITDNGNVGIGTDPSERLTVNGKIRAEEVKVEVVNPPDYVFGAGFELMSLEETKSFISKNKHLPEIPSASEMKANGVDIGDMNMKLLKKIEELTLYQIDLLEKVEELQNKVEKLEKK